MSKKASASSNRVTRARMSLCTSARSSALGCIGSMRDKRSLSTLLLIEGQAAGPWFFSGAVRRKSMETATFQKWLAEQGCRFDTEEEKRGTGHAHVTVHREGRKAVVPLGGPHQILDARTVRRACEELGLEWSELPGPKSRLCDATEDSQS